MASLDLLLVIGLNGSIKNNVLLERRQLIQMHFGCATDLLRNRILLDIAI